MPPMYLPLHKYLDGRYAETVVLGLSQIEDLMGVPLPPEAHVDAEWWGGGAGGAAATPQSRAWTDARRTATPNLAAHNVMFHRGL